MKLLVSCTVLLLFTLNTSVLLGFSDNRFISSTDKGMYGEKITSSIMAARGYIEVPSKYKGNNGIDHVFIKGYNAENLDSIIVAETKADTSVYTNSQLSNSRLMEIIEMMRRSSDQNVRETADMLSKNFEKISKELFRHDTTSGKTIVSEIGNNGEVVSVKSEFSTVSIQKKIMTSRGSSQQQREEANIDEQMEGRITSKDYIPKGPTRSRVPRDILEAPRLRVAVP